MKKEYYRITYAKAVHGREELDVLKKVLEKKATMMGPNVEKMEKKVAQLFAKKFGIMVNSGSSANFLAVMLFSLPKGSEAITPILTFATTVAPLVQNNIIPAFVDVDPETYQVNVAQIEEMINKNTKALVIPSLLGNLPDFPRLREIADKYNLYFLEDSCDTLGAKFQGKSTGFFSDISTTSFYGSHIITAGGNGGMICLNNYSWNRKARILRGWGRSSAVRENNNFKERFRYKLNGKIYYDAKFIFEELGYNFLPNELGAAFGLVQLKKLNKFIQIRRRNFKLLNGFFKQYPEIFITPRELTGVYTAWLAFPITIKDKAPFSRYEIVSYLEKNRVQTRPLFSGNILKHPAFKKIRARKRKKGYPAADYITTNSFLIGCHHGMKIEDIDYLKELFENFLSKKGIRR